MIKITWQDIDIQIKYRTNIYKFYEERYGEQMSHIEIHCDEELPITETGYKSIFILDSNIQRWGGVEKYITDELELAGQSEMWKFKQESKKQLCLF